MVLPRVRCVFQDNRNMKISYFLLGTYNLIEVSCKLNVIIKPKLESDAITYMVYMKCLVNWLKYTVSLAMEAEAKNFKMPW